MRRISLALALAGAVAATGCGSSASSQSGGAKGVQDGTFTVTVQNGQAINGGAANPTLAIRGGYVTSVPAGIDCGITGHAACSATFPVGTSVVLTATAVGTDANYALPYQFFGWAGSCSGDATCALDGNADKYVVTMFAGKRSGHPNWTDPAVHGPQAIAGEINCFECHGASGQGQAIAPSCTTCHSQPAASAVVSGLQLAVTSATVDGTAQTFTVNFTVKDGQGNPIAMPASGRISLSRIDTDASGVLPYAVLTPATGNPGTITLPAINAVAGTSGQLVETTVGTVGTYTYTSPALAKIEAAKLSNTHTLWIQASRQAVAGSVAAKTFKTVNQEFNFVPDSSGAPVARAVVATDGCNRCHAGFKPESATNVGGFHGYGRVDGRYCNVCHNQARNSTRTNSDPGTAPAGTPQAASSVFIHRIHAAEHMLQKLTTGTQTTGWQYNAAGAAMTECTVAAPCTCSATNACAPNVYDGLGEATYPQDLRNCGVCHPATAQGDQWKTRPSRAACGSCHDTVDFTTHNTGGTPAVEADCVGCHSAVSIATAHTAVVAKDTNNTLDGGTNTRTNAAAIAAAGALPAGASRITTSVASVSRDASKRPVITFKLVKDGADVVFDTYQAGVVTNPIADFVGTIGVYFVFAVPQDGITAPADFNASASSNLRALWNGSATGTSAGTLTGPVGGYYTATLTGVTVPDSATMLTGGIGFQYDLATAAQFTAGDIKNQPLTQTNLAAYPYDAAKGSGGLIVPVANAWKTATGYAARRAIVSNDKCNACHTQLGVAPSFHVGQRNDGPSCNWCHNPNRTSSAWSANAKDFIHGIHAGGKRTVPFTWHAVATSLDQGGYWSITYPGQLTDCQQCHNAGTYDFSAPASAAAVPNLLASTVATGTVAAGFTISPYVTVGTNYGSGFGFNAGTGVTTQAAGTTLVTSPIAAACFSCHDSATAVTHMESAASGGQIYNARSTSLGTENCLACHGPGNTAAPIGAVH